jgi:hypothetical protein
MSTLNILTCPRYVAEIVTVPCRRALSSPIPSGALLIVATSALSEDQIVGRTLALIAPFDSVAVAL